MHLNVKTFMVDATDIQVKYVVIDVWWHNPKVEIVYGQGQKAVEALARRIQTRDQLDMDISSLFRDHVQPETITINIQ